jgi:hypothetical protein
MTILAMADSLPDPLPAACPGAPPRVHALKVELKVVAAERPKSIGQEHFARVDAPRALAAADAELYAVAAQ